MLTQDHQTGLDLLDLDHHCHQTDLHTLQDHRVHPYHHVDHLDQVLQDHHPVTNKYFTHLLV